MYKAYFGLSENPFSITPDPRYLYLSPRHKEALAHLLYGITDSGGFIQLTGEVGTGKTTLTRALLEQLPEGTDLALILNPKLSVEEFMGSVCEEFKIDESGSARSVKEHLDHLTKYLLEQYSKGFRTVVLIDEAQNLTFDVIEQVRLLTNIETAKEKLLQIILVGQPELADHLNDQKLRQVAQRVTARYHLKPLSMPETAGYIKHRLKVAGVERPIFTPAAMRLARLYSGGIPRLINIICDRALLGAYATNKIQVNSKILTKAALEVKGGKLFDFGAPIRAIKNKLKQKQKSIQVEVELEKKKPRRTRVKKVGLKKSAETIAVKNAPVLEEPQTVEIERPVDPISEAKACINEGEAQELNAVEEGVQQKETERIAAEKAEAERLETEKVEELSADIEFGELVEDYDAPGYKHSSKDPDSDDVACELQEDECDKGLDEPEIINPLPSTKSKLQVQGKTEKALTVGSKVNESTASIKFAESIAKVQSLGNKEKIFIGSFAVVLMLAVMGGVFMPSSDSTTAEVLSEANQSGNLKTENQNSKYDKNKQIIGSKTVEQSNTPVNDSSNTKLEVESKGNKNQITSLSNMISSLKSILEQKVGEGKSSGKENAKDAKSTTIGKTSAEPVNKAEVKTQAANKQTKSKPVVKRNKLEKTLSAKSLDKSLVASFKELFKLWRLNYDSTKGETACKKSKARGLSCFFNTGSVEQLIRFNRPAILKFKKSKGFSYALLVKLSSESVTLDFDGEFKRFSVSDLNKVWGGKYITLWRPPKLSKMIVRPGEEGDHVRWLTMMMDRYDGKKTSRIDRTVYDENLRVRVDAFQKSFKLKVDGIIGKSTMAYLMAAAKIPGVPLLKKSK